MRGAGPRIYYEFTDIIEKGRVNLALLVQA